jgi:transcriptional regulator with XRE-family HTH domain
MRQRDDLKKMGSRIRDARKAAGLTQSELAGTARVSSKQINNIENARNWPSLPVYAAICGALKYQVPFIGNDFSA